MDSLSFYRRVLPAIALFVLLTSTPVFAQWSSLYVSNPRASWNSYPATIEEAAISVHPKGIFMEYGVYLTLSARDTPFAQHDSLEFAFYFNLPEDAIVTDSWLWVGSNIVRAEIMDMWTASGIYEDIVRRMQDPSILYKRGPGFYELRVFPTTIKETRKLKMTFLMPTDWTASAVTAPLPIQLIASSDKPVDEVKVMTWPREEWVSPRIPGHPEIQFEPVTDPSLGDHLVASVPGTSVWEPLSMAFDAPLKNGLYLSEMTHDGEGWYQMAMLPSEALKIPTRRKAAILIDYDASKTTVDPEAILDAVRSRLVSNLAPTDSFNILISQANILRVSENWLSADPAVIEAVFSTLKADQLSGYSNLPSLLVDGIEFIDESGGQGQLLLISSSDQVSQISVANRLIADLKALTDELPQTHIADLHNENVNYNWSGGYYLAGNDYLYNNLARLTGGNYSTMRNGLSLSDVLTNTFTALSGQITSFDLHTTLENGFAYGRSTSLEDNAPAFLDRPILQVGKYFGSMPFVVEASGIYDEVPFSRRLTIPQEDVYASDTTLAAMWTGQQILQMERMNLTNDVISRIVSLSLESRVLSLYTAFLALDPSQGGEICRECTDETGGGPTDTEDEQPITAETVVEAYPNPFSTETTISANLAEPVDASEIRIEVYNVMGQRVRVLTLSESGSISEFKLIWDGTNDAGEPLASGTYFIVITTPTGRHTVSVVLVR